MKVTLIRHFKTRGNCEGRYVGGRTDEAILDEQEQIPVLPEVEVVYSSPMLRCIQTSKLLFPQKTPIRMEGFRECDFGLFEYKTYKELAEEPKYQAWIDSGGMLPFPEGEDSIEFRHRCYETFKRVINRCMEENHESIAIIVHGGTIMSIMERFEEEKKTFYDYHVENGHGYVLEITKEQWEKQEQTLRILERV